MKNHRNDASVHLHNIANETKALLEATSEATEEKIISARKRLQSAVEATEETYEEVKSRVLSASKATDEYIHENPYKSLGIAFGVGALVGLILSRRNRE